MISTARRSEVARGPEPESAIVPGNIDRGVFLALLAMVICKLWLIPLRSGLWLDETGTYWTAQGSLSETIARSILWPAQSLLYSIIAWGALHVGGPKELMLRLPSILAMSIGAFLLYRLAVKLFNRNAAQIATLAFVGFEPVAFSAADARSYAIGLMAVIAATLLLVRWVENGRVADALGYAVASSLLIHMNYLFAVIFVVHAVYLIYHLGAGTRIHWPGAAAAAILSALLLAPLVPHLRSMLYTRVTHAFSGTPRWIDLFTVLTPPALVFGLVAGLAAAYVLLPNFRWRTPLMAKSPLLLATSWALAPVLLFFAISVASSNKIFIPRYLLPSAPGIALLAGWAISRLKPAWATRMIMAAIAGASLLGAFGGLLQFTHGGDWRAAMRAERLIAGDTNMPALIRSGFVESAHLDRLSAAQHSSYFWAPLDLYPAAGNVIRLPYRMSTQAAADLEQLASSTLEHCDRFVMVTSGDNSYEFWLMGRLFRSGLVMEKAQYFGGASDTLRVVVFRKHADRSSKE